MRHDVWYGFAENTILVHISRVLDVFHGYPFDILVIDPFFNIISPEIGVKQATAPDKAYMPIRGLFEAQKSWLQAFVVPVGYGALIAGENRDAAIERSPRVQAVGPCCSILIPDGFLCGVTVPAEAEIIMLKIVSGIPIELNRQPSVFSADGCNGHGCRRRIVDLHLPLFFYYNRFCSDFIRKTARV
jgi:hypothetical protein